MYEQFTDSARKSIAAANAHAKRFKHEYVGCLHMLLGVIDVAPGTFNSTSVDVAQLRTSAVNHLGHANSVGGKAAIESSLEQSRLKGSAIVDVQHLLIGILASPDDAVRSVFDELRMDMDHLRGLLSDGFATQ